MQSLLKVATRIAFIMLIAVEGIAQVSGGSVEGVVLDGSGAPLPNANVFVGTGAPSTTTDRDGRFAMSDVPTGLVGIHAYKIDDGYPYNAFAFFCSLPGEKLPFVEIKPNQATTGVVVQLGAKAGYLKFDISGDNGDPLDANLMLTRPDLAADRPEIKGYEDYRTSVTAKGTLMVPPVPFRLTVEAKGFEAWHYGGADWQTDKGLIKPIPGETINIQIRLQREK